MKSILPIILLLLFITSCQKSEEVAVTTETPADEPSESGREFYQIKTYTFGSDEQVATTDNYLAQAYLPALKRLGFKNIGVFKQRLNESDTLQKTYVLIPFSSMDQFLGVEEGLASDSSYLASGTDYINATYDQPPYLRIESTLLKAFVDMPWMKTPNLEGPRSERIYELRSYQSATEAIYVNKVDMFNAGGEVKLFDRLEFNAVFYGEVISGSKMPNLMYMTTFSNQESRDAHWKAFGDSPEWNEMKAMPKYQNNVSKNTKFFLYPTEYSDY